MEGKIRENVWWLVRNVDGQIEVIIEIHNARVIEHGPNRSRTFRKACSRIERCVDDLGKDYLNQMREDFNVHSLI